METEKGNGFLGSHPYFDTGTTRTAQLSALRASRILPPREFLTETEWDERYFLYFCE